MEKIQTFDTSYVSNEHQNITIKKVDLLLDLTSESYEIEDTFCCKEIVCVCGNCDLVISSVEKEVIELSANQTKFITIEKGYVLKIANPSKDLKVVVTYFERNIST